MFPLDSLSAKRISMNWKSQDWIEHASFGLGCVSENRGDRLDIDFIKSGTKTILRTTDLKPAEPPSDVKLPRAKNKSRTSRMNANMHVHASFGDFITAEVIPHQESHPEWKRLDGWDRDPSKTTQNGNRTIFAQFRHAGKMWKVHVDTKFAPLMEAYRKQDGDPFVEDPTKKKQGTKLQTRPPSKCMFIYLVVP
jgi:hypothetical protein